MNEGLIWACNTACCFLDTWTDKTFFRTFFPCYFPASNPTYLTNERSESSHVAFSGALWLA